MLNESAFLSKKIFEKDSEELPTRNGYGEGLLVMGRENPDVVVLCADLTESTRTEGFAKEFPDRFFEVGVAEQNMATVASGLGISGKIAYISSYATFSPGRNYEQIRTTIAYNNSNVKIAGAHAGISVGPDGATHQALEDIAIMRVMPNMMVFVPCDAMEAKKLTIAAGKIWGPVYLRFGREKSKVITTEKTPCTPGKAEIFWQSRKPQCAIIACGILVGAALEAAEELEKEKIGTIVVNNHTIKPLDENTLLEVMRKTGSIVTAEEHQINGGLGSVIAELSSRRCPVPVEYVGMNNTFGESGAPKELLKKYGMTPKDIMTSVRKVIKRKQ